MLNYDAVRYRTYLTMTTRCKMIFIVYRFNRLQMSTPLTITLIEEAASLTYEAYR